MNQESGNAPFFSPSPSDGEGQGRGWALVALAVILVGLGTIYLLRNNNPRNTRPVLKIDATQLTVEIADELPEQIQGLSGRQSLCPDCGMLFVYDRSAILSVWMKDMKFPLDIIFTREGKISEIYENVPVPETGKAIPTIWSQQEADSFLEVNAGFVQAHGLKKGDEIGLN